MKRFIFSAITCALLFALPSFASDDQDISKPEKEQKKKTAVGDYELGEEITITAERMEMHVSTKYTELTGNVLVQDATMCLTAEKILVYMDDNGGLSKVEAENKVAIRKLDGTESASGDRGVYDIAKRTITIEDDCALMKGTNILQCKKIIYDVENKTFTAIGGTLKLQNLKRLSPKKETENDVRTAPVSTPSTEKEAN